MHNLRLTLSHFPYLFFCISVYSFLTFCYHSQYISLYLHGKHERKVRMNPKNTSVLLIYTGGTIGMIENAETGALESFNFEQLQNMFPNFRDLRSVSTLINSTTHGSRTWTPMPGANWYASSATTTTNIQASSSCMAQTPWPTQLLHSASCLKG